MKIEQSKSMAELTTIQVGGHAKYYTICRTQNDVIEGVDWAASNKLPYLVIGGGSNTLIGDSGFDGLVIHIDMKGITWSESGLIKVAAGENWSDFVAKSMTHGFHGIECLAGIPGTVGATPIQNVGAYGQEVKHVIEKVKALRVKDKVIVDFKNEDCMFDYRNSRFKDPTFDKGKYLILEVWFKLKKVSEFTFDLSKTYPELARSLKEDENWKNIEKTPEVLPTFISKKVIDLRCKKGMVLSDKDPDSVSLGSFFMNPIVSTQELENLKVKANQLGISDSLPAYPSKSNQWKLSAAWLIERAGIKKGFSISNAGVSSKHCLALVNKGHATCKEILQLAVHIQKTVKEKFEVELKIEPEVVR